jgi:hypothetical protein
VVEVVQKAFGRKLEVGGGQFIRIENSKFNGVPKQLNN